MLFSFSKKMTSPKKRYIFALFFVQTSVNQPCTAKRSRNEYDCTKSVFLHLNEEQ